MEINLEKIKQEKPLQELVNFSIINIDKPKEWTSFDVVNKMRIMFKQFGIKKCGHFGTLDPMVTGVLPICLGEACKIQEYFMHHNKVYIGKMQIHKPIDLESLKQEMKKFIGKINQLPPRISRVKRQIRKKEIVKFELIDLNEKTKEAGFIAEVEAGTYIRKLIDDLGKNIQGAHMIELRRLKAGIFSIEDKEFTTLEEVKKALEESSQGKQEKLRKLLIPAEIITKILPIVEIKEEFLEKIKNGSPIFEEMLANPEKEKKIIKEKKPFAVFLKNNLVEIAKFSDKFENKSILAKPEAVLAKQ